MNDERGRLVGVNETLFRKVNEQIPSLVDEGGADGSSISAICQCGGADFMWSRGDTRSPEIEQLVERRDGWEVVCKVGAASEVAEENDPRS